jgi:hypothetical protein
MLASVITAIHLVYQFVIIKRITVRLWLRTADRTPVLVAGEGIASATGIAGGGVRANNHGDTLLLTAAINASSSMRLVLSVVSLMQARIRNSPSLPQ